jgi:hypothetical protein
MALRRIESQYLADLLVASKLVFEQTRECPLWVKSRHYGMSDQCPLYPQKLTFIDE